MSEATVLLEMPAPPAVDGPSLSMAVARMTLRLADLLAALRPSPELEDSEGFLRSLASVYALDGDGAAPALGRLASALRLSTIELDVLALAGLPDEHEGIASVLSCLHASGQPRASVGLAAQLLCPTLADRATLRHALEAGPVVTTGAVRLTGDGPFFNRTLEIAPALWSVLRGVDAWPPGAGPVASLPVVAGLDEWLATPACLRATRALRRGDRCTVLLSDDDPRVSAARAAALAAAGGVETVRFAHDAAALAAPGIVAHLAARSATPIVVLPAAESFAALPADPLAALDLLPGPVIACARVGHAPAAGTRPIVPVPLDRLGGAARARLWRAALPMLASDAERLATAYAVEPELAVAIAADVRAAASLDARPATREDVVAAVRTRTHATGGAAVVLRRPTAGWDALVLPPDRIRVLREALDRLAGQTRVLDEWGFLRGRPGARGVRLLLAGPPGTGKTLAAEVLAHELGLDLLVVDLARLVSKWLGDTEKHLADVFDAAERTQALLLFDEADALFGRRTEVTDAHDRYANLETAYLLARLERFEGLTVLSTNLKRNIDTAFLRRLEFVLDFEEPALEARVELWRRHVPATAPLAPDVDLAELAAIYPIVGGLIRNAAVAAGFLAAGRSSPITREMLVHAVRREYQKAGRAFPGLPPGLTDSMED